MAGNDDQARLEAGQSRVNLKIDVITGGAPKRTEIPLRLLAIGEFDNGQDPRPLEEREPVAVDKNNFDGVMRSRGIRADIRVPDRLRADEDDTAELPVSLRVGSLNDLHPDRLVQQIPELARLVAARTLLEDLRDRVINAAEFRRRLEKVLADPDALERLTAELRALMPSLAAPTAAALPPAADEESADARVTTSA